MTDLQVKYNQLLEEQRNNRVKADETHRANLANEDLKDRQVKLDESFQPYKIENTQADSQSKRNRAFKEYQQGSAQRKKNILGDPNDIAAIMKLLPLLG